MYEHDFHLDNPDHHEAIPGDRWGNPWRHWAPWYYGWVTPNWHGPRPNPHGGRHFPPHYHHKMPAKLVRGAEPECPAKAVIPCVELPTIDGLNKLYNSFVHVDSNNTTYYVDDRGMVLQVYAAPVQVNDYDYEANPLGLRSQEVWDFKNKRVIKYSATGEYIVTEGV